MNPNDIVEFADIGLSQAVGVLTTLLGFRKIGNTKSMDSFHAKCGKHLRWLGPVRIALALIQHFAYP